MSPSVNDLLDPLFASFLANLETDGLLAVRKRLNEALDDRAEHCGLFKAAASDTCRQPMSERGDSIGSALQSRQLVPAPAHRSASIVFPPSSSIPGLNDGMGDRLSPSQVNTFLDCQARWYYEKVLGLPQVVTSALALGRVVHGALAENFRQKIETKRDLETAGVIALFADGWAHAKDEVIWERDDDVEDLTNAGLVMVQTYMDQVAPRIEPAAVELEVSGGIAGVPVLGYIDLMDVNGTIVDIKTAKKKPSGVRPGHRMQVATYRQLTCGASGLGKVDTLVKSKTVQLVEQTFEVSEADFRATQVLYPLVQEAMRSGLYAPRRESFLCSRRHCAFWQRCEDEYGGEVAA